ncbi:MAG: phytoene desaturase [Verrucomicrobiales bacterium]|jgi:phytoene desaturase
MMKPLLDRVFAEAGKDSADYLDFVRLDPMYEVRFGEKAFRACDKNADTKAEIERLFPGQSGGLDRFLNRERKRFQRLVPFFETDFSSFLGSLRPGMIPALPHLSLGSTVFDNLKRYFSDEQLALLFSFQSKYLGMSAWDCPGAFAMLSYMEHEYGIYHTQGGLSEIPAALGLAAAECGARLHTGTGVKQLILDGRSVVGVELENGERVFADRVVINADFAQAMTKLAPPGSLKKYTPKKLDSMKFSCSTFMMHLGVDGEVDLPHHSIVFANDYKKNVEEIFKSGQPSSDISFYIRNASVTDSTIAPPGKSSLYVLVPTPNLDGDIDWDEAQAKYREVTFKALADRLGLDDLEQRVEVERIYTPKTWSTDMDIFKGATFNLSHNLNQLAFRRPRNRFEEFKNCYLVGGGTHPVISGSELPEGWKGKPWACAQGAAAATGDWLLFFDADTYLDSGGLLRIVNLTNDNSVVHSICPYHEVRRPYEQLSAFFNVIMAGGTTATGLFGQTLLVSRSHYDAVGGHEPVKDKVLENLHLAQHFNEAGIACQSYRGHGVISMRMFPDGFKTLANGWSKGFVSGAASTPRNALILISAWLSGLITIIIALNFLPLASLAPQVGILAFFLSFIVQCGVLFRTVGGFSLWTALLFPIPLCFYLGLFFSAVLRGRRGGSIQWKGRDVG